MTPQESGTTKASRLEICIINERRPPDPTWIDKHTLVNIFASEPIMLALDGVKIMCIKSELMQATARSQDLLDDSRRLFTNIQTIEQTRQLIDKKQAFEVRASET